MSPVSNVLIGYWHRLPTLSCSVRREHLAAACNDVRCGTRPPESLVIFALGDVDDEVVGDATREYLEAGSRVSAHARAAATETAIEWIRRGLALNGGAVFHALLEQSDATIDERLAKLRLALPAKALETLCQRFANAPTPRTARFLEQWRELVSAATDLHLHRQHAILSAALDDGRPKNVARLAVA